MNLNSQELLQLYRDGQSDAAKAIFDRYVGRLISLARARIGPKLKRRLDPEDVVQSAYRSFFVHAKDDEYQLIKAGDLWRLLASITLHKLHGQIEKHTAVKRSIDHEAPTDAATTAATSPEPTAAEVVAIVEELQLVIRSLPSDERLALTATLQGQDVTDISEALGKSERTVRRMLANAKRKIEQRLLYGASAISLPRIQGVEHEAPLLYSDYVLEQMLGSGGMGKVFRARAKNTGKVVAIKALHKIRQSDERAVSQFVQEAQVLAKLRHPNIVKVEGLGRFPGGGYFLVMEYVDGVDLQSRLDVHSFSKQDALEIVKDVANAIGHAHDNGIIHCDLKPGNVLQNKKGNALVTDFGFAFLMANNAATIRNIIGGTAGFIAPEIINFRSQPTPASDIYSLGVLMWTLVTGILPKTPLSALADRQDDLAQIAEIVRCCLSEDPKGRYQTATEFKNEIAACI